MEKGTTQGKVSDDKTGLPVRNASVEALTANTGTSTSDLGQFELTLPAGTHVLSIRHSNYAEKILDLEIYTNGTAELILEEVPVMLEEVVITDQSVMNSSITTTSLRVTDLKRAPVFLGEIDIVRQLQNQAGVTSVGEVAGGFNVRGVLLIRILFYTTDCPFLIPRMPWDFSLHSTPMPCSGYGFSREVSRLNLAGGHRLFWM